MHIGEILWLPAVETKLVTKHKVTTDKVEEVFDNQPCMPFMQRGELQGRAVYAAWGRTNAGRYLNELATRRNVLSDGLSAALRVFSADSASEFVSQSRLTVVLGAQWTTIH